MNTYWLSQTGPNHDFWGHEFSKHATCYSTFDVPCYGPEYRKHEDVVDFFETAIGYYKQLPTWAWLAKHDILPRNSSSGLGGYSLKDFEDALTQEYGAVPYLGCSGPRFNETDAGRASNATDSGRTELDEVWYYMHVYGRPQDHRPVPVDRVGVSGCTNATGGVQYYERTASGPGQGQANGTYDL